MQGTSSSALRSRFRKPPLPQLKTNPPLRDLRQLHNEVGVASASGARAIRFRHWAPNPVPGRTRSIECYEERSRGVLKAEPGVLGMHSGPADPTQCSIWARNVRESLV